MLVPAIALAGDFTASPSPVRVGKSVSFNATGLPGTATGVSWSFGDGSAPASGNTASHAYSSPGTFSVTMTVTDSAAPSSSVSHSVVVNDRPSATFSFNPAVPNVAGQARNAEVSFNSAGTNDPLGTTLSYSWDFGDGSGATTANPKHTYGGGGGKLVTLTVTAADGTTGVASKTVRVNYPPSAMTFIYVPENQADGTTPNRLPGQDPYTPVVGQGILFFGANSTDPDDADKVFSYEWDLLGDLKWTAPSPSTLILPYPSYSTAGQKTVHLRVTDKDLATDVATATFRVNSLPTASFTVTPDSPGPNQVVQLSSTSTDPDPSPDKIVSTAWELNGDGKFDDATGTSAAVTFTAPGDYTVGLKTTDTGGAFATAFKTVSVKGPPTTDPPHPDAISPTQPLITTPITTTSPMAIAPNAPAAGSASSSNAPTGATGAAAARRAVPGVRVQIAGSITGATTRITLLLVVAPPNALVTARCSGSGCAKRATRQHVPAGQKLRLRGLERTVRAGAKITVTIAAPGYVTRHVLFTIKPGQPPSRRESCVTGTNKTGPCPA